MFKNEKNVNSMLHLKI